MNSTTSFTLNGPRKYRKTNYMSGAKVEDANHQENQKVWPSQQNVRSKTHDAGPGEVPERLGQTSKRKEKYNTSEKRDSLASNHQLPV